jgi:hypothetical protein
VVTVQQGLDGLVDIRHNNVQLWKERSVQIRHIAQIIDALLMHRDRDNRFKPIPCLGVTCG